MPIKYANLTPSQTVATVVGETLGMFETGEVPASEIVPSYYQGDREQAAMVGAVDYLREALLVAMHGRHSWEPEAFNDLVSKRHADTVATIMARREYPAPVAGERVWVVEEEGATFVFGDHESAWSFVAKEVAAGNPVTGLRNAEVPEGATTWEEVAERV